MKVFRAVTASLLLLLLPQAAQTQRARDWDPTRVQVSRSSLQELLRKLEETAESRAYSGELRARARREAELLRNRLVQGDFQVGDRVLLRVERQTELTDTFTVVNGPALLLPTIGQLPLAGVLRSELESHIEQQLSKYIVDPVVDTRSLMRVLLAGGINQPGFYTLPADALLTDVIMHAGGPTRAAKLTDIYIERSGQRIWEGEALQQAITEGRTLDQLSLRAGDRIVVAESSGWSTWQVIQTAALVISPLVFLFSQIF